MENDLLSFYHKKFLNFEKILEEYGLTQKDIVINSAKEGKSWIHSGIFYDCNNLYPCLRNLEFRDPYPDLSLLDIGIWDLKVFFAKLRTVKTDSNEIGTLLRFCIDNAQAVYHLSHQIYIHLVSSSTSDQHVMAVFYLMADILVNSKYAETYVIAFGERLPFMMMYLYRIFRVLSDGTDSMGLILRVKHVLWILDKMQIYPNDYIRKLYNIFLGLFNPQDDTPHVPLWDTYMFENLNVMNDFMVFKPHDYSKVKYNSNYKLLKVDESGHNDGEKPNDPSETAMLRKFLS